MQALRISPGIAVREISDRADFASLEQEWNALDARCQDELFYRHEFVRAWIDNFAPTARLRVLTGRDAGGRLVAALPLVEQRAVLYGVPLVQLASAANKHSCRFDLLAEDAEAAGLAFFEHLAADPSWDLLRLTDVPEGGRAFGLFRAAGERGYPTGSWQSLASPYVPLPASFAELHARLGSKLKANVRRRRRKLEQHGEVRLERYGGGLELEARLEEGYALEASGWKGERGTAIALDRSARGFYSELARLAAYQGWLSLYFLRVAGRAVAFHYGLTYGGRYLLLKPGYDESLRECSPGQLLVESVLEDSIGCGLHELDFLGPDMTWKRDWTDRKRVHTWLFVFRDSLRGRALRAAKFRWVPVAKEAWARWCK